MICKDHVSCILLLEKDISGNVRKSTFIYFKRFFLLIRLLCQKVWKMALLRGEFFSGIVKIQNFQLFFNNSNLYLQQNAPKSKNCRTKKIDFLPLKAVFFIIEGHFVIEYFTFLESAENSRFSYTQFDLGKKSRFRAKTWRKYRTMFDIKFW